MSDCRALGDTKCMMTVQGRATMCNGLTAGYTEPCLQVDNASHYVRPPGKVF
jgi:hypothetical protein